jgi:hypothetical protein
MTYKLVISKPGKNALTETNPNNLIFSSDYNTLKYFSSGYTTINIPNGSGSLVYETTIVNHNLGYYPFFIAYFKYVSPNYYYLTPVWFSNFPSFIYNNVYATTNSLIFYCYDKNYLNGPVGGFSVQVYWKIFKNNLNL